MSNYPYEDEHGTYCWRYVGGKRIKIYKDYGLAESMKMSGKFPSAKKYNTYESFKTLEKYKNMSDEEYEKSYKSNNDYVMEEMAHENRFDKSPIKVSSDEYNQLIQDGNIRVQRVVSADINNSADYYVNEFKNGKIYYTNKSNMYGNGIYTSNDKKDIELYSKSGKNSKVIEMVIDKNANIKKFKDQTELFKTFIKDLKSVTIEYQRVMENPGRLYMSKGYDGIYIEKMGYYIMYNRGKIYVKE